MSAGGRRSVGRANSDPDETSGDRRAFVSVVIPVYNEEENLPELYQRLVEALDALGVSWEVIFSDDALTNLDVIRQGNTIELSVRANAFLHHMVRNIAGVLIAIGAGEAEVGWAREVLEHRDRTLGGITAPPDGLYFERVEYEDEFQLPRPHNGQVFYT